MTEGSSKQRWVRRSALLGAGVPLVLTAPASALSLPPTGPVAPSASFTVAPAVTIPPAVSTSLPQTQHAAAPHASVHTAAVHAAAAHTAAVHAPAVHLYYSHASHHSYSPHDVAVVLTHTRTLGEAFAAEARAMQYDGLSPVAVEQTGPASFDVVVPDVAGYKVAETLKAADKADFLKVTIESSAKLALGTLITTAPTAYLGTAAAALTAAETSTSITATYVVSPGDSLWSIANTTIGSGMSWYQLASLNKLSNPDLIMPGQMLQLPPV